MVIQDFLTAIENLIQEQDMEEVIITSDRTQSTPFRCMILITIETGHMAMVVVMAITENTNRDGEGQREPREGSRGGEHAKESSNERSNESTKRPNENGEDKGEERERVCPASRTGQRVRPRMEKPRHK